MTTPPDGFAVPVEAGHVARFAEAVGEHHPAHRDAGLADREFGGIVAPPTFAMVADHFDPDFPRRPHPPRPWFGSGRRPTGVADDDEVHEGLFHVEQRFAYERHPRAGEVLTAHRRPVREWTRQGRRGGRLDFYEATTSLYDADGREIVTAVWLDVRTERGHAAMTVRQPRSDGPADAPTPDEVPEGTTVTTLVDDLSRTQLVMYVGAAGDFHPLHHDDVYARHRGYPGVFAPGMLTMAMSGRAVTDVVGPDRLTEFGGRFLAQVWPGDTLVARVSPTPADHLHAPPADGGQVGVLVTTTNQDGTVVFDGWAAARPR